MMARGLRSKGRRPEGCGCGFERAVLGLFVGMGMLGVYQCRCSGRGLCCSLGQCLHEGN